MQAVITIGIVWVRDWRLYEGAVVHAQIVKPSIAGSFECSSQIACRCC